VNVELLRTALAERHEALGARMVPFSGWAMPVQYSAGIVAEHLHTRSAASLFDLSHMGRLRIDGSDALALIQQATTNDASRLDVGAAQYSLICNDDGGVIEDLLVYRLQDGWLLVVNASNRVRVIGHLDALAEKLGCQATVRDETFDVALIGVQGPESEAVLAPLVDLDLGTLRYYHAVPGRWLPGDVPVTVSRTGYTGEDGFELMIDAATAGSAWDHLLTDARVRPAGLGARDTLRLEAGMALYGHELNENVTPYEAKLGRVVRPDKGPFVGRDALAARADQAPERRLVGLGFDSGAVPRAEYPVNRAGRRVGQVTSGTFSPSLKRPIAMAYVESGWAEVGTELTVSIRGAEAPARVVSLPFVPHNTKR
jgi:aminomethyltransferase